MLLKKELEVEALELLTMSCILIGVKIEEIEIKMIYDLLRWFRPPWKMQLQTMELFVCQKLNWNLYPITPMEIIENLSCKLNDACIIPQTI